MAKFVESAILRVIDQSTNRLNSITKAMKAFRAEANRLKKISNIKIDPKINLGKIEQATKAVQKLNNAITRQAPVKSSTAGINQTMRALQRLQRQIQSMQGKGVNVPVTGGRGYGGGGGRFGGGRFGGGAMTFNTGVLDLWAAGFIYRLGHTIESSIVRGFQAGTKRIDDARTYSRVLGYTPEQIATITTESERLSAENPRIAASQFLGLYNELGPELGADPTRATKLVEMAANLINMRLAMGKDMDQAMSGMRDIFKALNNMNRLQDDQGNISAQADDYFKVIMQMVGASGADLTPEQINTAIKFSRTAGQTVTPEGLRVILAQAQSMGRVAGSSINAMVESFVAPMPKLFDNLEKAGFITTKKVIDGYNSKGQPKYKIAVDEVLDAELLYKDANLWTVKNLIPYLQKQNVDLNQPEAIANELRGIFGQKVARSLALNLVTWQGEYQRTLEAANAIVTDNQELNKFLDESTINTFRTVANQSTEVIGQIGDALLTKLLPAANAVAEVLANLASFVDGGGTMRAAGVAGGAGIAALGGAWLAKTGLGWLTGVGGLNVAAVNLNTSAAALQAAALSLGASGVPGVPAPGGGNPAKTKTKVPMAAAGPLVPAAVALAAIATLNEITSRGSENIANTPDLAAKEAEANARNTKNIEYIKSFFQRANAATPSANPSLPEGTQTTNWRDSLNKFLWGDAADPNFNGKDAFGIEIGASKVSEAFNEGSEIARGKIAESTSQAGTNIASALLAAASQIGASIGASMQANFNPGAIPVTVNANAGPDTGNNPNGMR